MGLGYVSAGEVETDPTDGTLLLSEAQFSKSEDTGEEEEKLLSLVSLNERQAASYDFCRSDLFPGDSQDCSEELSCGRATGNVIVLEDPRVSSIHFVIRVQRMREKSCCAQPDNEGVFGLKLIDKSCNGTWVNDKLVGKDKTHVVRDGDRIFVLPSARVGQQEAIGYVVMTAPSLTAPTPPIHGKERHLARVLASSVVQCRLCCEAPVHRCMTAVPCGHNFDLGCLLAWRFESDCCPACGDPIRQAVRNRVVDGVTSSFLESKPEARRSSETLELLEAAEKGPISAAMLEQLQTGSEEADWRLQQLRPRPSSEEPGEVQAQSPSHLGRLKRYIETQAKASEALAAQSERSSGGSKRSTACVVC